MIYLEANTAGQTVYLNLNQERLLYSDSFTNYLLILTREENTSDAGYDLAQVATIVAENERFTQLTVTTVPLISPGRYRWIAYGQNSAVNLNPLNAAVIGEVGRGWALLSNSVVYLTANQSIIQDDVRATE